MRPSKAIADADFARMVQALCKNAVRISQGEPAQFEVAGAPPEAHSLAEGLTAILQLVDREWKRSPLEANATGIKDAFDLVTALMEGKRHPIFDYTKGIQKAGVKVGTISVKEHFRRALAVALYRACGGDREAAEKVEHALHVSRTTVMTWNNKAVEVGDRFPEALETEIRAMAGGVSKDFLAAAVELYRRHAHSPHIG